MDLSTLSSAELRDLQQQIPGELKRRETQEKTNALNELRELAKSRGFVLEELVNKETKVKVAAGTGAKVKVKYRHPQDESLAWTGRGRRPKWVDGWIENGGTIEQLLV